MTTNIFIDTVCRIRAIIRNTNEDATCPIDKRNGMYQVATEWYRSIIKHATTKQFAWLYENFPSDYYNYKA